MTIPTLFGRLSILAVSTLLFFLVSWSANAEGTSFLAPLGPIAAEQKLHFFRVIGITMIAMIPVFVLLPFILLKYRRSRKSSDYQPKWEFSLPLEMIMWAVPLTIVAVLSVYLWKSTHALDPYAKIESENPTINVQVVGLDWKWLFIYPDLGIASVGEMAFPADHPVSMTLTTDTVMQSFIISSLAGQIYAMPGMTTELNVIAPDPGEMQGENMQYNGSGFTGQKFIAKSMVPADFETWVQNVRQNGVALDDDAYAILSMRSSKAEVHTALAITDTPDNVIYFKVANAGLFHNIVGKYHTGDAIPAEKQPGTRISTEMMNNSQKDLK